MQSWLTRLHFYELVNISISLVKHAYEHDKFLALLKKYYMHKTNQILTGAWL